MNAQIEAKLAKTKQKLISSKQQELLQAESSHDALVREKFHMERFVLMTEYDPKVAKEDNSPVFQEYKASHDLVLSSASPSRSTRRAREDFRQTISAVATSPKQRTSKPPQATLPTHTSPIEAPPPPRKRRKTDPQLEIRPTPTRLSTRISSRKDPPTCEEQHPLPPLLPVSSIKRIKLVLRKPIHFLSNPDQRPQPPQFQYDIAKFLKSYKTLNGKEVTEDELRDIIVRDAHILNRAQRLRMQGRIMPGTAILFGEEDDDDDGHGEDDDDDDDVEDRWKDQTPSRGHRRDLWDIVVEEVVEEARMRHKLIAQGGREKHLAGQVAGKLKAHWDAKEARRVREVVMQEKKIKALAKITVKLIQDEWKKVVVHIREQERLRNEAEEVRKGQTHLDAILDQSGQLLETQQSELFRAESSTSRSGSIGWGNEPDSDDEDEEEEEEREDEDKDERHEQTPSSRDEDNDDRVTDPEEDLPMSPLLRRTLSLESIDQDASLVAQSLLQEIPHSDTNAHSTDTLAALIRSLDIDMPPPSASTPANHVLFPRDPTPPEQHFPHEPLFPSLEDPPSSNNHYVFTASEQCLSTDPLFTPPNSSSKPPQSRPEASSSSPPEQLNGRRSSVPDSEQTQSAFEHTDDDHDITHSEPMEEETGLTYPPEPSELDDDGTEHTSDIYDEDDDDVSEQFETPDVPEYLKPFAVAPVQRDPDAKVTPPLLLRGILRPYQQSGLEWLASLHTNNLNGILADEMGLGKTIQTIALLAHLACDHGIWGPHLIIVPTSVLLNWEMEFKKFLPGFKVLSYHGSLKRRRELRQGWTDKHHINACITSYTLASRDSHILKKKAWYYMILDEAHMIKNFKSQRWNILLMFRSFRRLLLTGTPLQNNLTELWALLQFLMAGSDFANLKEFGDWFSNPLERAIEMGNIQDDETQQRVQKLHTVLRPYLLRRLKRDVEKELPHKYDHLVLCPLSKRQRFLYDEFMSRRQTRDALESGQYQQVANILMQLRKVCNHPDLFEVRPIVTSFAMPKSAVADFEIKELLVRRRLLQGSDEEDVVSLGVLGLQFIDKVNTPILAAVSTRCLDATYSLPCIYEEPGVPPAKDTRTIEGYQTYAAHQERVATIAKWKYFAYLNRLRCSYHSVVLGEELIRCVDSLVTPITPFSEIDWKYSFLDTNRTTHSLVKSYADRSEEMAGAIDKFAFITPSVVAPWDFADGAVDAGQAQALYNKYSPLYDQVLHRANVKLRIAFPDPSLLQYDCGKLQQLTDLLREKHRGGHRILIFTQMTRILDILEIFLNLNGYLYLRLDGSTKIEDRQYITERFNADSRVFAFIASSRSGGVGINLTGADTVIFYDSDFNPQMDRQCEDRAHRIGQIRDVHIYRFVSQHTVEEAMLRKANQKRSLDDLVIQKGKFDWGGLFGSGSDGVEEPLQASLEEGALTRALGQFEDREDQEAARQAAEEEVNMEGTNEAEFGGGEEGGVPRADGDDNDAANGTGDVDDEEEPYAYGQGGSVVDFMLDWAQKDWDFFSEWRI